MIEHSEMLIHMHVRRPRSTSAPWFTTGVGKGGSGQQVMRVRIHTPRKVNQRVGYRCERRSPDPGAPVGAHGHQWKSQFLHRRVEAGRRKVMVLRAAPDS